MNTATTGLARELWGVFERMQRFPADFPESGTARHLAAGDTSFLLGRAEQEWSELHGCVDGTHRHSDDFQADFLLESSQVFYWLALAALTRGLSFDQFLVDQFFGAQLAQLESEFVKQNIDFASLFVKDLAECKAKGYLA